VSSKDSALIFPKDGSAEGVLVMNISALPLANDYVVQTKGRRIINYQQNAIRSQMNLLRGK
jgi:hypothetical protein